MVSGKSDLKQVFYLSWFHKAPEAIRLFGSSFIPPLIIIFVNQILLYIIYILANMESHHRYSVYQMSLLTKTFWYFLLNIIIMPGFAAAAFSNMYQVITVGFTNRGTIFDQIFLFEKGDFFIILVMQYSATSFFRQQTNFTDFMWSYFSPSLTRKFKQLTANKENWMKHDYDVFTFGNDYAQNVVIFGIGIVFQ